MEHTNQIVSHNSELIEKYIKEILRLIGEDVDREGLLETPKRVRKMYEEIFSGYQVNYKDIMGVTFNEEHNELVIVSGISFYSQCEHHMVPFFGKVHIGYMPNGRIVGLSKFARLVDAVSRKLQVQERITSQLVDIIMEELEPFGAIAIVEAEHLCMCARGVKKPGSKTTTTAVRGIFKSNDSLRSEFLSLLKN